METLHTWWATELYPMRERDQFGVSGEFEVALAADAQATIAALQARVQELEAVLAGDLELTKLHYEPGQPLEFQAKHPLIAIMAASMAQMCDDLKAENYVEVQFNHHEKGHFILTVQKMFHPTPHQLRQKAESHLTQLTAELEAAKLEAKHNSDGWDQALEVAGRQQEKREALQAELERVRAALEDACLSVAVHGEQPPQKWLDALQHRQGMEGQHG